MAKAKDVLPALMQVYGFKRLLPFEEYLELKGNPLSKLLRRDSELSVSVCVRIIEKFPDVNPAFLLTGKGPVMLTPELKKALHL